MVHQKIPTNGQWSVYGLCPVRSQQVDLSFSVHAVPWLTPWRHLLTFNGSLQTNWNIFQGDWQKSFNFHPIKRKEVCWLVGFTHPPLESVSNISLLLIATAAQATVFQPFCLFISYIWHSSSIHKRTKINILLTAFTFLYLHFGCFARILLTGQPQTFLVSSNFSL